MQLKMISKIAICILLWLSLLQIANSQIKSDYESVLTRIFMTNGYKKKVLPRELPDNPVEVDLSFVLLGINGIDELSEKMNTTGYLIITWFDYGLQWTPSEHNNTRHIFVPQNDIWRPDIFLQNGFTKLEELGGSYYYIEVEHEGDATWMPYEVFETRCSLDTSYFPFDKQTCSISFVTWSHSIEEIVIQKSSDGIQLDPEFQPNSVWDILSISHEVSKETRESKIKFTFLLKRKPFYYVVNIILPVVFLGLLNGLVFVIPADTGEKTGYSVTVFLSLAVFLTIVSKTLPVNSEKISFLGIYLLLQIIIGVMVLIVTSLQLRLNASSTLHPVSGIYSQIAKLGKKSCCCVWKTNRIVLPRKEIHLEDFDYEKSEKELPPVQRKQAVHSYSWSDVVIGFDLIGFWCFVIIYMSLTTFMFVFLIT